LNNWIRNRGAASPFWTAINDFSCTGYTAYWETTLAETLFQLTYEFSPRWGIFEYHPDPYMTNNFEYFAQAMELLYANRCQILVPLELWQRADGTYPLIGTPFADAVNSFFDNHWPDSAHRRFDQPYFNTEWIDYLPPEVKNVTFNQGTLSWSNAMWENRPDLTWSTWGEFDHFEVFRGDDMQFIPNPGNMVQETKTYSLGGLQYGYYKVLAVSKLGVTSPIP